MRQLVVHDMRTKINKGIHEHMLRTDEKNYDNFALFPFHRYLCDYFSIYYHVN